MHDGEIWIIPYKTMGRTILIQSSYHMMFVWWNYVLCDLNGAGFRGQSLLCSGPRVVQRDGFLNHDCDLIEL